jgi:hypothetical protein
MNTDDRSELERMAKNMEAIKNDLEAAVADEDWDTLEDISSELLSESEGLTEIVIRNIKGGKHGKST